MKYALILFCLISISHYALMFIIRKAVYEREIKMMSDSALPSIEKNNSVNFEENLKGIKSFKEVRLLDDDGDSWSQMFSHFSPGVLIFDANGDNLLDIYLTQDGDNWTRPTDKNGVLKDKARRQHNNLYINRGNDSEGNPIYKQISELTNANDLFTKEELLVENYLFPRENSNDKTLRKGRKSNFAVAADFNGDGRLDILVGNGLPGMVWSHKKTQRVLTPMVNALGRQVKKTKLPLSAQGKFFVQHQVKDETNDTVKSSRGTEAVGANSLFLNMGDKDNDGAPEWLDVSKSAGIEGKRNTFSLIVADFDLDGDLDIYEANVMDFDFWPGGAQEWAGGANALYLNQLKETGKLSFIEQGSEMDVDGVYDDENPFPQYYKMRKLPFLPEEYSFLTAKIERFTPKLLKINGQKAEAGQISWASTVQDVNDDGYPDIWVANDLGVLRLYINKKGKGFELGNHARSDHFGFWMTLAPSDFNGDGKEDLYAGNLGGSLVTFAFTSPDPTVLFKPVISDSVGFTQFNIGRTSVHSFINGVAINKELKTKVKHSLYLPPDASLPNNVRKFGDLGTYKGPTFDQDSFDPYEFAWGVTILDVQNDGKPDMYYFGCLYGRGGGIFSVQGTNPGRLLINKSDDKNFKLEDRTAEYQVFNIDDIDYSNLKDGFLSRKAPSQNWPKRDRVYSYDRSVWVSRGPEVSEKITNHDMNQTAENGKAVIAADFNNDGYEDLLLRNLGGYDSRSNDATNLKVKIDGKIRAVPAHDNNYPSPTNFDPGATRFFMNTHKGNNWVKVRLLDDTEGALNRNGIGGKVLVNGKLLKIKRVSDGGFGASKNIDLHFGLGKEILKSIQVVWPDKSRTKIDLEIIETKNSTIIIKKTGSYTWLYK